VVEEDGNVADSFYEKALGSSRRLPEKMAPRARAEQDIPPVRDEDIIELLNAMADSLRGHTRPACPTCNRPWP
jgi:hypothetical protein